MKKEIADKWVKALRSDKYKQGKNALHNGSSYCCLGVLTDLYVNETNDGELTSKGYCDNDSDPDVKPQNEVAPHPVLKWSGLQDELGGNFSCSFVSPEYEETGEGEEFSMYDSLAEANDAGISFAEIADFIEENYKHL